MPDWKSLEELQKDAGIFTKFMHALLGLYAFVPRSFYSQRPLTCRRVIDMSGLFPLTLTGTSSLGRKGFVGQWCVLYVKVIVRNLHTLFADFLLRGPIPSPLRYDRHVSTSRFS